MIKVVATADGRCVVSEGAKLRQLRQEKGKDTYAASASGGGSRALAGVRPVVCVGCGGTIADVLSRLGSTRCHDCRDGVRPPARVEYGGTHSAGGTGPSVARALLLRVRARQRWIARRPDSDHRNGAA
jgi:hypothetical protein